MSEEVNNEATPAEETPAAETTEATTPEVVEEAPVLNPVLALAADARYTATGKRKTAVARVTLKPGTGVITVNGRELNEYFPRPTLQMTAKESLEKINSADKVDVIAKVHGGGVAAQAGAVRHGIARALLEANGDFRGELKRAGFLTRDARVKERKKAGLKKARKRPQFSKR
jgi:small subunit ribosomal protein S9